MRHLVASTFKSTRSMTGFSPSTILFFLAFVCLGSLQLYAQPKQDIPPFMKPQKATQTVELNGKAYRLPDFSLARVSTGGPEFITQTPFGFLAINSPNPLLVTEGLGRTPNGPVFDFTKSAPHLAFFCRLEINENAGGIIPAKFRLGGVKHWQDNLRRRE